MEIKWSELAIERVSKIIEYIALDNPNEAEKWVHQLFDYLKKIAPFPRSGRVLPELPKRVDIKEIIFGNYRVIYRIDSNRLFILTVKNTKQILPIEEIK
jgi:toxin ParE1/3/4